MNLAIETTLSAGFDLQHMRMVKEQKWQLYSLPYFHPVRGPGFRRKSVYEAEVIRQRIHENIDFENSG